LVNAILGLTGLPAYLLVTLLPFGETAAMVGLFVPGELAVVLGGG
jgi:membrane-associated protein